MAPFVRGRSEARGGNQFATRGAGRGRGSGRARGRGSSTAKKGDRSTFFSTRIEEKVDNDADPPQDGHSSSDEEQSPDISSLASSDEDAIVEQSTTDPYNALLQSLNAGQLGGPPQRKKRKIEIVKSKETNRLESHEQRLEKQHETGAIGQSGIDDPSDVDESNTQGEIEVEDENATEDITKDDPFSAHFADPDENQLATAIENIRTKKLNNVSEEAPSGASCSLRMSSDPEVRPKIFSIRPESTQELRLKQKLQGPAVKLLPTLTSSTQDFACPMFGYNDMVFVERNMETANALREVSCVHILNHLYKTRDKIIRNNARLAKDGNDVDLELRDQGFTRPKVLIILPTRQACAKWVDTIVSLCEPEQQENRKRFQDSYTKVDDTLSDEKPMDFRELFGGNDDDMFRVGLKLTRKTIKYFSQFYSSDIIFASPLGLRMAIGAENDKKHDHDFLSSIEILIADHADALAMQNWEHIEYIFEHLNLQPKEAHGCDFSRVKNWYLDGNARYLRQTMIFSAFNFPALNRLYNHHMNNVAGKMKIFRNHEGLMLELGNSIKQTFSRFECADPTSEPDDRFTYFTTAIVPILNKYSALSTGRNQGILIYLPSYADFVRVRNYLATSSTTQNLSFGSISEYTSVRDVARARSHFFTGRHSVLLYTERAHHFRRYHLRGVRKVFMYGVPENPIFYKEVVGGFLGASISEGKLSAGEASVRSLFSKLDILKLERVVGCRRISSMIRDKGGDTFDFL